MNPPQLESLLKCQGLEVLEGGGLLPAEHFVPESFPALRKLDWKAPTLPKLSALCNVVSAFGKQLKTTMHVQHEIPLNYEGLYIHKLFFRNTTYSVLGMSKNQYMCTIDMEGGCFDDIETVEILVKRAAVPDWVLFDMDSNRLAGSVQSFVMKLDIAPDYYRAYGKWQVFKDGRSLTLSYEKD